MRRILGIGCLVATATTCAMAAQQTLTGEISDSMCGASHAAMGDMGKNPKECTAGCVKGGAKYVFVSKGRVYGIANQSFAGLPANAAAKVAVTGDVDSGGKNITVTKIARAAK